MSASSPAALSRATQRARPVGGADMGATAAAAVALRKPRRVNVSEFMSFSLPNSAYTERLIGSRFCLGIERSPIFS